jgi:hypothetical protein
MLVLKNCPHGHDLFSNLCKSYHPTYTLAGSDLTTYNSAGITPPARARDEPYFCKAEPELDIRVIAEMILNFRYIDAITLKFYPYRFFKNTMHIVGTLTEKIFM